MKINEGQEDTCDGKSQNGAMNVRSSPAQFILIVWENFSDSILLTHRDFISVKRERATRGGKQVRSGREYEITSGKRVPRLFFDFR